jgi:uncharacterized protein YlxW (UPF0749 family)
MSQPPTPVGYSVGSTGLLSELMSNTLDRDYQLVASTRSGRAPRSRSSALVTVAVVIAVFGAMLAISAVRTAQQRPADNAQRAQIVSQIHVRQRHLDVLHAELGTLETQVGRLQGSASTAAQQLSKLTNQVAVLAGPTGTEPVTGPGIVVTTDDAPGSASSAEGGVILDTDLQSLVNALWSAGAEAIAVNGQRITGLTAIRYAGRAITVNYRSLSPPYTIDAIGDPDTLPARLLETPGGQAWLSLRNNFHIAFSTSVSQSLTLPGDTESPVPGSGPDLTHAHILETP